MQSGRHSRISRLSVLHDLPDTSLKSLTSEPLDTGEPETLLLRVFIKSAFLSKYIYQLSITKMERNIFSYFIIFIAKKGSKKILEFSRFGLTYPPILVIAENKIFIVLK